MRTIRREGARPVHTLPAGAQTVFRGGLVVVVHPAGPPYTIDLQTYEVSPLIIPGPKDK